ncbi:MAG: alpha/beta hydrolase [Pseudomonadota bacterium]
MNYAALIDDEIQDFIQRTGTYYPPDATDLDVTGQRRVYDAMCAAFRQPRPDGVEVVDQEAGGVACRIYSAGNPNNTVIYFHGGGFVVGGLDSHDDVCAEICAGTGYRVLAVDYRLAPEHVHPAHFDDARAATNWAAETFSGAIVLAGDSAGGNLAAAVAHWARGSIDAVRGQVLIYPGLGGEGSAASYTQHAHAPLLTTDEVGYYTTIRAGGDAPVNDPSFAPLEDANFSDLPPTLVFTADCDPLRDDGRDYCDRMREAGGQANWINEAGLVHGYLRARTMSRRARDSFGRIVFGIEALGQGIWPSL